jgi:hypothetical protein
MSRRLLACGFAGAMALTASLGAQSTPPRTPDQTPAQTRPKADDPAISGNTMVIVEGCLRPETDVPGRAVPEREHRPAVADADWVLTDTKMIKGMQPQVDGSSSAVGTSGTNAGPLMYTVKSANDHVHLGDHSNKRVSIEGVFTHEHRADNPVAYATDLVKLNASSIREVPGTCPKNDTSKRRPEKP